MYSRLARSACSGKRGTMQAIRASPASRSRVHLALMTIAIDYFVGTQARSYRFIDNMRPFWPLLCADQRPHQELQAAGNRLSDTLYDCADLWRRVHCACHRIDPDSRRARYGMAMTG